MPAQYALLRNKKEWQLPKTTRQQYPFSFSWQLLR